MGIPRSDITSLNLRKQAKVSRLFHICLLRARSLLLESKREIHGFFFLEKMSTQTRIVRNNYHLKL